MKSIFGADWAKKRSGSHRVLGDGKKLRRSVRVDQKSGSSIFLLPHDKPIVLLGSVQSEVMKSFR